MSRLRDAGRMVRGLMRIDVRSCWVAWMNRPYALRVLRAYNAGVLKRWECVIMRTLTLRW